MFPKQLISVVANQLTSLYDAEEANAIATELVLFFSGCSRAELLLNKEEMKSEVLEKVQAAIPRLLAHEPLQYVIGEAWFYGLPFKVNPHVLIPRPETEELVEKIINKITSHKSQITILDIGTGSGCIPITLKKHLPQAQVYGLDISQEALEVANHNALLNKVEVNFVKGDILNSQLSLLTSSSFDIIVSNPPYITDAEKPEMGMHVLDFEPHTALFVTDGNPLQFYEAIAVFASKRLKKEGLLFVEINKLYGHEVKYTFEVHGFKQVEIHADMHGNERMVTGVFAG